MVRTWVIFQKKKEKKTRIEHGCEWEFEETEDEARVDRKRADRAQHRYLISCLWLRQ